MEKMSYMSIAPFSTIWCFRYVLGLILRMSRMHHELCKDFAEPLHDADNPDQAES